MPKYIDIHAHVNFKAYDGDKDEVIIHALSTDVSVINTGTLIDNSR